MTEQWVSLLIQVPLVGAFIWYSLKLSEQNKVSHEHHLEQNQELQNRFFEVLDKRDTAFEQRTKALIETMNVNNRMILDTLARMEAAAVAHDGLVREKLASCPQNHSVKVRE